MCEILLENQADVDHADKEGKSALFAAASMGHLDIVNILLFWGCYADGIDCEGRTVLSVAAAEGSAGVVQVGVMLYESIYKFTHVWNHFGRTVMSTKQLNTLNANFM